KDCRRGNLCAVPREGKGLKWCLTPYTGFWPIQASQGQFREIALTRTGPIGR
ncbi:MAG: hypothetical protein ACI8TQ_003827, partial [Planctomycetota bacterium]